MKKEVKNFVESVKQFNKVIKEAGGTMFSLDALENMNALELIEIVGNNGIDFVCAKKMCVDEGR